MEDQPNYQPNGPGSQTVPAPAKPQKSGGKTLLLSMVLIIFTAAIAGGATWYYMNNKNKISLKEISTLKTNVDGLNKQITEVTSGTKGELVSLYDFCNKDLDAYSKTERVTYIDNANGKMATCKYEEKDGKTMGWQMIAGYTNGKWDKIWAGSDSVNMEQINCTKYKIPSSIYAGCTINN
jgi:hypothetical protein